MKKILMPLMMLLVARTCVHAAVTDPLAGTTKVPVAADGTSKPAYRRGRPVAHKMKGKKASPIASTSSASEAGRISASVTEGAQATAEPSPSASFPSAPPSPDGRGSEARGEGINTLDDVVLQSALAPMSDVPSPFSGEGRATPGVRVPSSGLRAPSPEKGEGTTPSLHSLLARWVDGSSPTLESVLSGGLATFRVGGQTDVAAEVAIRIRAEGQGPRAEQERPEGEDRGPDVLGPRARRASLGPGASGLGPEGWALELGSILPHEVPGGFDTDRQTQGTADCSARLRSFYEIHAAAIHDLPHGDQEWVVPEIGLGLSVVYAVNEIHSLTTYSGTYQANGQTYAYTFQWPQTVTDRRWSVSPLVRLGVVFFPRSLISLRVEAAYVSYADTAHAFGQTFDLGAAGVTVHTALGVRL